MKLYNWTCPFCSSHNYSTNYLILQVHSPEDTSLWFTVLLFCQQKVILCTSHQCYSVCKTFTYKISISIFLCLCVLSKSALFNLFYGQLFWACTFSRVFFFLGISLLSLVESIQGLIGFPQTACSVHQQEEKAPQKLNIIIHSSREPWSLLKAEQFCYLSCFI